MRYITIRTYIHCMYLCDSITSILRMHMLLHTCTCTCVRTWFKVVLFCMLYTAAPPAITVVEVNEICTNDFTVSWTPASNEEGLSYNVTLFLGIDILTLSIMNTSYNFTVFTGLITLNTNYNISVSSVLNSCSGTPNTIMLTTATLEAGVPQSELIVTVMDCTYVHTYLVHGCYEFACTRPRGWILNNPRTTLRTCMNTMSYVHVMVNKSVSY